MNLLTCEQLEGDKENFLDFSKIKVKKIGKNRAFVGPISVNFPIDNTYVVEGRLYQKQGGEYKETPFKLPKKPLCDFVNGEKFFLPKASRVSELVFPLACPLTVVSYLLTNDFEVN